MFLLILNFERKNVDPSYSEAPNRDSHVDLQCLCVFRHLFIIIIIISSFISIISTNTITLSVERIDAPPLPPI